MKQPAYVIQSRNGVYYLRFILPKSLHEQTQRRTREIRVSTHTKDPRDAAQRARLARVLFDQWVYSAALSSDADITTRLQGIMATFKAPPPGASKFNMNVRLPDGTRAEFTDVKDEEAPTVDAMVASMQARSAPIYTHAVGATGVEGEKSVPVMVEEYLKHYSEKLSANKRSQNTLREEEIRLRPFKSYFENMKVRTLNGILIKEYLTNLRYYPQRRDMLDLMPGKSVREVMEAVKAGKKIKYNGKAVPSLSLETIYQYARSMSRFLDYCGNVEATTERLDRRIDELINDLGKAPENQREPFTDAELKAIFENEYYTGCWYNKPHQYWIPLVGLFTGARLSEISQLHTNDIEEIEPGKWMISFNDDDIDDGKKVKSEVKSLKNSNSKRTVPMHSKLVKMGLVDYWSKRKKLGVVSLWDLKPAQKDGWGKVPGDFFSNDIRDFAGISDPGKVFHSFRYTFITRLWKQVIARAGAGKKATIENYPEGLIIRQMVGHSVASDITRKQGRGDDVHFKVYTGDMGYDLKSALIERLDVGDIHFTPYRQPAEGQRKRYRDHLRDKEKQIVATSAAVVAAPEVQAVEAPPVIEPPPQIEVSESQPSDLTGFDIEGDDLGGLL